MPGLTNHKDFDIAIEIGHHQRMGVPLTLKKLQLLNIATTATVRRHLGKMIAEGTVIKNTPASDRRTAHLTLNPKTMEALDRSLEKIHHTLCISMTQGRDD